MYSTNEMPNPMKQVLLLVVVDNRSPHFSHNMLIVGLPHLYKRFRGE